MPDDIVIDSIKKMLALKMQDEDIIGSLVDAGVDYDNAVKVLNSVKKGKTANKEDDEEETEEIDGTDLGAEELPEDNLEEDLDTKQKDFVGVNEKKDNFKDVDSSSLDVWQEGVLSIINEKLEDIEKKQKKLSEEINSKVKELTSSEITKINALLNSQRELLVAKVNSSMASQTKDFKVDIDKALSTVQQLNAKTQQKLEEINDLAKDLQDMKKTLSSQIETVQAIKQELSVTVDKIKQKAQSELENIFSKYKTHLEQITGRVNSTMNLSSKIMESLVNGVKEKITDLDNKRVGAFEKEIADKLNIEDVSKALAKLDAIKDIDKKVSDTVAVQVSTALESVDNTKLEDSITDLNKRIMEIEKRSKGSSKESLEGLEEKVDELMIFKEQNSKLLAKFMQEKKSATKKK